MSPRSGKVLKEAGLDEQHSAIEFRFAEGDAKRLLALAADLVARKVDLIFAGTTAAALAAKGASSAVPMGGNITGISFFTNQMETKRLGLLHEAVPKADLIAVLLNPNNPFFQNRLADLTEASRALGVAIDVERATNENEIAAAFKTFGERHAGALLVGADLYFTSRRALVVDPASCACRRESVRLISGYRVAVANLRISCKVINIFCCGAGW